MSVNYDIYLEQHIENVNKAANWLQDNLGIYLSDDAGYIFPDHDKSKYSPEEYEAYDKYFYGKNRSFAVTQAFKYAWLHHIHNNPHHWQHWVLLNDDEPEEVLEMPIEYVIEMICDWWSFSFAKGNLMEIFDWYEQHKDMKLHPNTRKEVEKILDQIRNKLKTMGTEGESK